jgi:hypothetical protein
VIVALAIATVAILAFLFIVTKKNEPAAPSAEVAAATPADSVDRGQAGQDPVSDTGSGGAGSGAEQAAAVDSLLDDSAAARSGLGPAVQRILSCTESEDDVTTISQAEGARRDQLSKADDLKVDALIGGEELKQDLMRALTASLRADEHFLAWARRYEGGGCDGRGSDIDFTRGDKYSQEATAAKRAFLLSWNRIADETGRSHRQEAQI